MPCNSLRERCCCTFGLIATFGIGIVPQAAQGGEQKLQLGGSHADSDTNAVSISALAKSRAFAIV